MTVKGPAPGDVRLGSVWALPPPLALQFHPLPQARLDPYAGLGVNRTVFHSEGGSRTVPASRVDAGMPGAAR